jgi:hypothetical protein
MKNNIRRNKDEKNEQNNKTRKEIKQKKRVLCSESHFAVLTNVTLPSGHNAN